MNKTPHNFVRAHFFRRLAAIIYDLLVAVAIGMCAAIVITVFFTLLYENGVLDKNGIEHVSDVLQESKLFQFSLQFWVSAWVMGFFLWFWRNGGQTIGMRAWRLRMFSTNDKPFGYGRALLRLIFSLGGLGTLLVLIDWKSKLALQDRVSHTEILVLSKEENHHAAWKDLQD
ncbi:RDD family protein [Paraglaciecola aquimarina]|uniref:RDD family protein n=1 Tax=Paraglaciecola algarum TaxID=3050085 RepID=A0ABS9D8M0_9ALTE|nr:RDD family protein [Paraglaciecola sp. G1-23]MCF2948737.1 RDD family protein [Paraglaciecola sp. G1-23]